MISRDNLIKHILNMRTLEPQFRQSQMVQQLLQGFLVQRTGNQMKTARQIIVFPFEVLLMGIVMVSVVVDLIGCAVGVLCNLIEGPQ